MTVFSVNAEVTPGNPFVDCRAFLFSSFEPRMDNDLIPVLITAIIAPLTLKLVEYMFNKSSEQTKAMNAKVEALTRRVDEFREKNTQLEIQIGILQSQLIQKDHEIAELQKEITAMRAEQTKSNHS